MFVSTGSSEEIAIPQSIPEGATAASFSPPSSTSNDSSSSEESRQPEAQAEAEVEGDPSEKGDKAKPKKNRCYMCRKKVGLTGRCDSKLLQCALIAELSLQWSQV